DALAALGRRVEGSALVAERRVAAGDAIRRGADGLDPIVAAIIGDAAAFCAEDAYRTENELATRRGGAAAGWAATDLLALPTPPIAPTLADVAADPLGVNGELGTFT